LALPRQHSQTLFNRIFLAFEGLISVLQKSRYNLAMKSEQPYLNVRGLLVLRDRRCHQVMGIGSPEFIEASQLDSNLKAF
jgi:hypothetical protein